MKLPHKLDKELSDEKELRVWLNQLRDYLSDKEEDNLACCGGRVTEKDLEEYLSKDKEASKGECVATKLFSAWATTEEQRKKWDDMAVKHLKKNCACHPPQQEESRGECGHVNQYTACDDCGAEIEPQLKEESPKEDEVTKLLSIYRFEGGISESVFWQLVSEINEKYVSKEKIKKILNEAEFKGDSGYCGKCSHIVRKLEGLEEL